MEILRRFRLLFALTAALFAAAGTARAVDPAETAPGMYTTEDKPFKSGNAAMSLHKMNYAVQGKDGLKLQYSFKYRLIDKAGIFFAYTNYMLWEVFEDSIPTKDIVFNPEFFYRLKEDEEWFVTLDAGYFHLSNGQDGLDSRAIDRLFVRGQKSGRWGKMPWHVTSQVFLTTLAKGDYTADYSRYVGWWDVSAWLRNVLGQKRSGLDLQYQRTSGVHGNPFNRGSNLLGLQYQLVHWERVNPSLYLQWFSGYGEFMIDYSHYQNTFRGGISWFY